MEITLNGHLKTLTDVNTVAALVESLGYTGKRIAVERNGEIVPKSTYSTTPVAPGDQIEIVVAVGGG
jgi:sulfur carrier protein